MADKKDLLERLTFKDQCDDDAHRVFYTLTDNLDGHSPELHARMTQHRVANVLAGIVEQLMLKQVLTVEELDEILLRCRG